MTAASASAPSAMTVSPGAGWRPARSLYSLPPPAMSGEPDIFQNAFNACRLGFQKLFVFVADKRDRCPIARLAGFCPLRRCRHFLDQRNHVAALRIVDARGRKYAAPIGELDVDTLLFQRG